MSKAATLICNQRAVDSISTISTIWICQIFVVYLHMLNSYELSEIDTFKKLLDETIRNVKAVTLADGTAIHTTQANVDAMDALILDTIAYLNSLIPAIP
jgi:hypothetical protein